MGSNLLYYLLYFIGFNKGGKDMKKNHIENRFDDKHSSYQRPKKICGIYKITNLINKKKYIGKSIDIERRFREHKSKSEWRRTPRKPLYLAFQKYGLESFSFEVLEECDKSVLNKRERYWIKYYQTNNRELGYNIREGGEGSGPGEEHENHKVTEEDVRDIRIRYNNHERKYEVEKLYENKIGHSGFHKIWTGETWSDIMPDVYTEENKKFHKNNTGCNGSKNGRALLTEEDVYNIRLRKKNGEDRRVVFEDYKDTGIKFSSFTSVWNYQNWKNIIVD